MNAAEAQLEVASHLAEARQQLALYSRLNPGVTMLAVEQVFSPMQDRALADRIIRAARQAGIPD